MLLGGLYVGYGTLQQTCVARASLAMGMGKYCLYKANDVMLPLISGSACGQCGWALRQLPPAASTAWLEGTPLAATN